LKIASNRFRTNEKEKGSAEIESNHRRQQHLANAMIEKEAGGGLATAIRNRLWDSAVEFVNRRAPEWMQHNLFDFTCAAH
jgi:sensor domain CHASE-containing protein